MASDLEKSGLSLNNIKKRNEEILSDLIPQNYSEQSRAVIKLEKRGGLPSAVSRRVFIILQPKFQIVA